MPVRLIGRPVRAVLHASEPVVYDGRSEIARHERLIVKGKARLDLDHYGSPGPQARSVSRGHHLRTGPIRRDVHARP
ncbi:hypothetical protein [Streptomyces phaeoluteigriseus]|uniref:hypothetical protein n=1 Tax=Streptomyces phaeoluteigriseus TaxID=114686 RepID=UPI003EB91CE3